MAYGTHDAVHDPRNDAILVSVNGKLCPRHEATVSVFDSGYLLGDGVWEGLRLHEGVLVFLEQHLHRLYQGAKAIALDIGLAPAELTAALYQVLDANRMHIGVHVRLMITRGVKHTPSQDPRLTVGGPTIVIIAEHKRANPAVNLQGISLFTSTVRRGSPDYLDPRLNCHSKLHEVIALQQALYAGADEALMLDLHGFVSTCNATNFFIVRAGEVWTSTGQYCLHGITRSRILALCPTAGIPIYEKNFSLTEVYDADEAFVTGTFAGLIPVHTVDGRAIGTAERPLLRRLQSLYRTDIAHYVATHPRLPGGAGAPP